MTSAPTGCPESREYDPPLDEGIAHAVEVLVAAGIETFESCEGGSGHSYPEPTVRFHGMRDEGFRALAAALLADLRVSSLRRSWSIIDGEPTGPHWEMTFTNLGRGTLEKDVEMQRPPLTEEEREVAEGMHSIFRRVFGAPRADEQEDG